MIYSSVENSQPEKCILNKQFFLSPPVDNKSISLFMKELKKIQNSIVFDKSFPELFYYDYISLWWPFYQDIFIRIFDKLDFIMNFSKFVEENNIKLVIIENDFETFDLIRQICNNKKIKTQYSKSNYLKFILKQNLKNKLKKKHAKIKVKKQFNKRKNFTNQKNIPNFDNSIIFTSGSSYRRSIFNPKTNKNETGEFLTDDLVNLLDKNEKYFGIDFSNIMDDNKILNERINDKYIQWIPLESLISFKINLRHKKILDTLQKFFDCDEFQNLFKFKDVSYWKTLQPEFQKFFFDYYAPYWMMLIDSLRKLFSKSKPKAIILPYEYGPLAVIFIYVAKEFGIKTLGIQHGIIYEYHPGYMHEKFYSDKYPYGFPLPDKILMFGAIPQQILIKNQYPKEKLVVFGNPAFFNLEKMISCSQETILQKYSLNKNKKIILYFSSGYQRGFRKTGIYYDELVWDNLLKNFANNEKFIIILKPHPRENIKIYEDKLKEFDCSNFKIIQGHLNELILISDVIISTFSTTIIDSMCFQKSIITVIFDDSEIKLPFIDFDVVNSIKLEKLPSKISELLKDTKIQNHIYKSQKLFLKKYYNIPSNNPKKIFYNLLHEIN